MAATTTLLGLVTPTQGTLSGTWGDTVNYGISDYVDIAIAGTLSFAGDGAITLANTTGSSSGNGIISTTAQYMVIRITGTQTVTKVITGPSYSKLYMVDHAGATSAVTFKASGQTGVSVAVGEKCFVYYNGTDYVKVASSVVATGTVTSVAMTVPTFLSVAGSPITSSGTLAVTLSGTALPIANGGTGTTSTTFTNLTTNVTGTLPIANGGTGQTTATAAFTALAPSQGSNSGKFLTTNGTNASWAVIASGISQVTTATTATTLTNTPTLLQITPASYGVTVTLPDATTCSVGGPVHCIDNTGAYPVRVCNTSGTLLGFIYAGVVSYISLDNNSTAAGVWAISSNELVGASAQLLTTNISSLSTRNTNVIDLGSGREIIIGNNATNGVSAVAYDKTTNTFGSVTLVRNATITANNAAAVLSAADQVLVVSCTSSGTAFEAVTLSISGTTITVNTAATATLSANFSNFADGCSLIAVGSSFVTSYTVATPAAEIRALSISGTTVTIGSATVLDGTTDGLIANATTLGVVAASATAGVIYHKYYGVSGTTITTGSGGSFGTTSGAVICLAAMASGRWFLGYSQTTANTSNACFVSLSGTTTSVANQVTTGSGTAGQNAFILTSTKVFVSTSETSNNNKIVTDTAGTASVGTAITNNSTSGAIAIYLNGNTLYCGSQGSPTAITVTAIDVSGASPVLSNTITIGSTAVMGVLGLARNSVLVNSPNVIFGTQFAQSLSATTGLLPGVTRGETFVKVRPGSKYGGARGKADSERWLADAVSITKTECVV